MPTFKHAHTTIYYEEFGPIDGFSILTFALGSGQSGVRIFPKNFCHKLPCAIGGWLVANRLGKLGPEVSNKLIHRVT